MPCRNERLRGTRELQLLVAYRASVQPHIPPDTPHAKINLPKSHPGNYGGWASAMYTYATAPRQDHQEPLGDASW
jgi:hypothetical protein